MSFCVDLLNDGANCLNGGRTVVGALRCNSCGLGRPPLPHVDQDQISSGVLMDMFRNRKCNETTGALPRWERSKSNVGSEFRSQKRDWKCSVANISLFLGKGQIYVTLAANTQQIIFLWEKIINPCFLNLSLVPPSVKRLHSEGQ